MPWNDRSLKHVSDVETTIGCLQSIVDRFAGCLFLYGGDFNVTESSRNDCSKLLHEFCSLIDVRQILFLYIKREIKRIHLIIDL